jgi:hypothetical protein
VSSQTARTRKTKRETAKAEARIAQLREANEAAATAPPAATHANQKFLVNLERIG